MAKKTRKALKHESQQRAIQQAVANVSAEAAPAKAAPAPVAPTRAEKVEQEEYQEFVYVKSDVRRSFMLAGLFMLTMIVLSFIVR
jgi:ribosomal protein L12E/L44/L45/RPP1/RPP2